MLPVKICSSNKWFWVATFRCVVLGLVFAGCTTVRTERTSADQSLRSRTVRGPSSEIFDLVGRCLYREFPDGLIRTDATVGEIKVTDYSMLGGDAVIKVIITGWPDDRVEVNISAVGLGAAKQKTAVGRFLDDFDHEYADWAKGRMVDRLPAE